MKSIIILCSIVFCSLSIKAQEKGTTSLTGAYLGHPPPGLKAKIFAPGIVSTEVNNHSPAVFSKDGNELFWSYYDNGQHVICYMQQTNGFWDSPKIFNLTTDLKDGNPFFSSDWKKLIFHSGRGNKRPDGSLNISFWYIEKETNNWSNPNPLNLTSNLEMWQLYGSQAKSKNIYFTSKLDEKSKEFQLFVSIFNGVSWDPPQLLEGEINNSAVNWTPYISPDESYLIFSSDRAASGTSYNACDLYISFKQEDGNWGTPINMGDEINTEEIERFPCVSPDGKYLFFVRGFGNVYWISTSVFDHLNPNHTILD